MEQARKLFTRTLLTRLTGWGLVGLAGTIPVAVNFIFILMNPGGMIVAGKSQGQEP
ncbi:MAG: hypothetical protein ACLKAK_09610 [Alkaliphilus sp.]